MDGAAAVIDLELTNSGTTAALATKATLFEAKTHRRILPAYFSDNYVSILPGESKTITVRYPAIASTGATDIDLRGWNVEDATVAVASR